MFAKLIESYREKMQEIANCTPHLKFDRSLNFNVDMMIEKEYLSNFQKFSFQSQNKLYFFIKSKLHSKNSLSQRKDVNRNLKINPMRMSWM